MIIQELQEKKEHYRQSVRGIVETLLILLTDSIWTVRFSEERFPHFLSCFLPYLFWIPDILRSLIRLIWPIYAAFPKGSSFCIFRNASPRHLCSI